MQMMNMNNPYYMNHRDASTYGIWRQPIVGSNWRQGSGVVHKPKSLKRKRTRNYLIRNENVNYGNEMANGDVARFGKHSKKLQFQNRNKSLKFNGGGARFQARGTDSLVTPVKPVLVADGLFDEVEKEWGVDRYGTMSGLIKLRTTVNEDVECGDGECGSSCTDEDEDYVNFERRLTRELSKYEIVLPKGGSCVGSDLKSGGEGRSHLLESENLMLKQSLCVMDRDMDDLKRRMEVVEMRFRAKVNKGVKENGCPDGGESVRPSVDLCMNEVNAEVESGADDGENK